MNDGAVIAFFSAYAVFIIIFLGLIVCFWVGQLIFFMTAPKYLKRIAEALEDIADAITGEKPEM